MAPPLYFDRVMETSTTTGTGTYTLAGAVTGFQSFAAVGDGNTCYYCAFEVDGNGNPSGGWEVGLGTYTASGTTLARTTVLASSNSGSAVDWAAGTRRVMLTVPASVATVEDFWTGRIRRGSDLGRNTTTTPADDGVLQFDMTAAVLYHFELHVVYASPAGGATPDFKFNFAGPATLDGLVSYNAYYASNDTIGAASNAALSTAAAAGTAATKRSLLIKGWCVSSGGGTGASGFRFQWSQNTSNGNDTVVYAESILRYRKMT